METIKASELRIGNEFYNTTIESIGEQGYNYFYYPEMGGCWNDFDSLIPIPITEELLLEYGFEINEIYCEKDNVVLIKGKEGGFKLAFYHLDYFYFLHQLQNLYFALTNKELNK